MYLNLHIFVVIWSNLNYSNVLFIENHIQSKKTERCHVLDISTSHIESPVGLNTKPCFLEQPKNSSSEATAIQYKSTLAV